MSYEKFKLYMISELNDVKEINLIKLHSVYETFSKENSEQKDLILKMLVFLYKELDIFHGKDITNLLLILLYIHPKIALGCENEEQLIKTLNKYPLYYNLDNRYKKVCLKYIRDNIIKKEVSSEEKGHSLVNYYKKFIKKKLSVEQCNNLIIIHQLLLDFFLEYLGFDQIIYVISECFNNNDFNYNQSFSWCMGRCFSYVYNTYLSLSNFYVHIFSLKKYESIKKFLDKYFILGSLSNLNYKSVIFLDTENEKEGQRYFSMNSDNMLLNIAESIEDYFADDIQVNKNEEFIYGIIIEGINKKLESESESLKLLN